MEKLIHFVWVGYKPIDKDIVIRRQEKNTGCQVIIWADKQTMPKARGYTSYFFAEEDQVELSLIQANYSAASDMTRNKVLRRYGGLYIDIDIESEPHSLSEAQLWENEKVFKTTNYSQGKCQISNDVKLSSPGYALITAIEEQAKKNYSTVENLKNYANPEPIWPARSGNVMVRRKIHESHDRHAHHHSPSQDPCDGASVKVRWLMMENELQKLRKAFTQFAKSFGDPDILNSQKQISELLPIHGFNSDEFLKRYTTVLK